MKGTVAVVLLALCLVAFSCSDDESSSTGGNTGSSGTTGTTPVVDVADPVPGDSGTLSLSNITTSSLTVTWSAATDDVCTNLEYKVVYSTSSNIFSIADAEANGTVARDWSTTTNAFQITNLETCWQYYVNVLVRDQSNHMAIYAIKKQWTRAPCPPAATGQDSMFATGDDGDLETGAPWPNPRFTNNGNGTVTDNLTGLIWQQAASATTMNWTNAIHYANTNTLAGQTDWRIPNINELRSLYDCAAANLSLALSHFSGIQTGFYFSSTTDTAQTTQAYGLYSSGGDITQNSKANSNYVIIVRGSSSLPKTGQTTSYVSGDDGDLERGIAWPDPRFLNNGDGTITDRLTGLMWEQTPGIDTAGWSSGISHAAGLTTGGYTNWRMPNRNEMFSLAYYKIGQRPYEWLNACGFVGLDGLKFYQSSTTRSMDSTRAFYVTLYNSSKIEARLKTEANYTWAVR